MKRARTPVRIGAAFVLAPAVLFLASGPALAASNVNITNTETVQAHLNADGTVQDARVYEQVALQGDGTVTFNNPVSTKNLRNLDGFGNFEVKDGSIISTQTVNGEKRLRSVSDYGKKLPLTVAVVYKLDGKIVDARDVVGKSGLLEVRYTVANVTGKSQEVTFDDGTGKMITQSQQVVIPMVGSLTTLLPSNFTDVRSGEASMAGDGSGRMKMTFTMTLFSPIATPTAEFGYSAQIKDGLIPAANVSALPVNPLESPSFKGGAASYKGGADSGITLTAGATEIDANVLKLRDGAQTLIAGLIQLRDGAKKLNTGLAGAAAPGANALADGASQLKTGAGRLAAGAGDAKAGSAQLSAGTGQLATGAGKLNVGAGQLKAGLGKAAAGAPALIDGLDQVSAGLTKVDDGLGQLYGGINQLPAKAQPIHDGIQKLLTGLGDKTTAGTLIYGVNAVRSGLAANALPGIDTVVAGLFNVPTSSNPAPGAYQKLYCAQKILTDVVNGTLSPLTAGSLNSCYVSAVNPTGKTPVLKGLTDTANYPAPGMTELSKTVTAGVQSKIAADLPSIVADPAHPTAPNATTLVGGLYGLRAGLDTHAPSGSDPGGAGYALSLVECGLSNATLPGLCDAARPGLLQGLALVDGGVSQLVSGVVGQVSDAVGLKTDVAPAQNTLRGGVHAVMGGIDQISAGGLTLLDGLNQLNTGAGALKTGTGQLVTGANKLAVGAGQLDTGLGQLSSGASLLSGGTTQLFDGANKLAAGLGAAATGSGQLADGLTKAVDGGKALPAGAARLSAEGTSKLVEAGKSTASAYGLKYAVMVAGANRAKTEAMAYGAPADAAGATAYSLDISGANPDGDTSVGRGVGALALFGAGGGLVFLRRRFV